MQSVAPLIGFAESNHLQIFFVAISFKMISSFFSAEFWNLLVRVWFNIPSLSYRYTIIAINTAQKVHLHVFTRLM